MDVHSTTTIRSRSSQSPSPSHSASASASSSVHHRQKLHPPTTTTTTPAPPFSLSDAGDLDSISPREEDLEEEDEETDEEDEEEEDEEEEDNDSMRAFTAARLDATARANVKPPKPDVLKVDSASAGGAGLESGVGLAAAQQNAGLMAGIVVKDDTVNGIFTENIQTSGAYSAREEGLKREVKIQ